MNKERDVFKYINMQDGDSDKCWEWKGPLAGNGRPMFSHGGKREIAYRVVARLVRGNITPTDIVRHTCDNPLCCNPSHLELGTQQDNMNDMKSRDRHGVPKIVVTAIFRLVEQGQTHEKIAELYGLARETVTSIVNKRRHADDQPME